MNTFVVLSTLLVAASAAPSVTIQKVGYGPSSFVRAPAHDSASIESHRLGGNFAYSTAEAHAYASVTPEISVATHPVAETTYVHQPAPVKTVQPAPVVHTTHAARPVFGQEPILAKEAIIGPVATRTEVHQPIFKKQHVHYTQPLAQVQHQTVVAAAPAAVAVKAAPVATIAAAPVAGIAAAPAVAGYGLNYGIAGAAGIAATPLAAGIATPAIAGIAAAPFATAAAVKAY